MLHHAPHVCLDRGSEWIKGRTGIRHQTDREDGFSEDKQRGCEGGRSKDEGRKLHRCYPHNPTPLVLCFPFVSVLVKEKIALPSGKVTELLEEQTEGI